MSSKEDIKICPYPFARIEVRAKSYVPCCHGWLNQEYHQMEVGGEPWNGPAAQELRRRIYNGDYSLCRRDLCGVPITTVDNNEEHEAPISIANHHAIRELKTVMPDSPSSIGVVADPRCNLNCPSCRSGFISTVSDSDQLDMQATERSFEQYAQNLKIIRFGGDGEVFFSSWKRKMLASISREKFPQLDYVELTTNGIFCDEKNFMLLLPGSSFVRRVSVSVDAGNEETYIKVRGKDWQRLMSNLQWLSERRKDKQLRKLQINFTVRLENFLSIPEFVKLGESLAVDSIKFTAFFPWHRMAVQDYAEQAVHLPNHPRHHELVEIYNQLRSVSSVHWALEMPNIKNSNNSMTENFAQDSLVI